MPDEAKGTSKASAKAFVRYWIETLNYAGPAGDTSELKRLSDRSCNACTAIIALIDKVNERGGHVRGDGWTVRSVKNLPRSAAQAGIVLDALVQVHPQEIQRSASDEPTRFVGGSRLKTFWLASADGNWLVTRLDQPQ